MDSKIQEPSANDELCQRSEESSDGFTLRDGTCIDLDVTAFQIPEDGPGDGLSIGSEALSDLRRQANLFVSDSVQILSRYVKKDCIEAPYYNVEELRHTMRSIAIKLTNADPELKASILTLLSESSDLLSLLALFIRQQFNGELMLLPC